MASNRSADMTPEVNAIVLDISRYEDDFLDMYRASKARERAIIEDRFKRLPPDMTNRIFLHRYYRVVYMPGHAATKNLPPEDAEALRHEWHEAMDKQFFATAPPTIARILDDPRDPKIVHLWERYMQQSATRAQANP